MKRILFLALLLSGCGQQDDPAADNHGYGWGFDEITDSGLRVRYSPNTTKWLYPSSLAEQDFQKISRCMGISAPGPLIVFVDEPLSYNGSQATGFIYFDTNLILLNYSHAIGHEVVHYLLNVSGYDQTKNAAHDHPAFQTCAVNWIGY